MAGRPRVSEGWDSFGNVVPGDVPGAMAALNVHVISIDESGEAKAKCPAHFERLGRQDRRPSFSVNIRTGLFGCWSCQFRGKFTDLVRWVLKCDDAEAIAWVRARGTIQRVEYMLAKRPEPVDTSKQINEASLALCVPPPEWALADRGISGHACARYGVVWEPYEEMWITPIRDEHGVLHGWQEKNDRYFGNQPVNVKKSGFLFGYHTLPSRCERIVLVESPLDAPIVWEATGEECLSSYGAGVSARQLELIRERTNHLVLFLDNDAPGHQARDRVIKECRGSGLAVSTVDYGELERGGFREVARDDLDPGELFDDEIAHLVSHAVPGSLLPMLLSRRSP